MSSNSSNSSSTQALLDRLNTSSSLNMFQFLTTEQELELLDLMDQDEAQLALHSPHMGVEAVVAEATVPKTRGAPKGPRTAPEPECRCMARVWGCGGRQCMSSRNAQHGDYCKTHGKAVAITCQPCEFSEDGKKTGLFLGRIDQPRPTHNAEGERCVIWDDEDQSIVPNEANPATFLGEVGGGWSLHSSEGKKAATLLKRWNAKNAREAEKAAKEAEKLLKASAKKTAKAATKTATKEAEKLQKTTAKKAEKAQTAVTKALLKKTLPKKAHVPTAFFNWLNAPGTRDVITKHLSTLPARTTVVRQSEVTSMAGQMWKLLADDAKAQWKTAPATQPQAAE